MDMPVNVPIDDPNADTEWNDILRKHGVIPEKPPSPTPMIEEALTEARRLAHENRLEGKDLDELNALEDEEDDQFLEHYRKQRMMELSNLQKTSIFNQVYPLQKPDYARDVTEASKSSYVLVHLTSSSGNSTESGLLTDLWRQLARKFGDVKFCEIRGDMCIEGYPDKNCPTILVYHNEDIVKQIVTLRELKGRETKIEDLEKLLIQVGAIKQNDHRVLGSNKNDQLSSQSGIRSRTATAADSDDEWD